MAVVFFFLSLARLDGQKPSGGRREGKKMKNENEIEEEEGEEEAEENGRWRPNGGHLVAHMFQHLVPEAPADRPDTADSETVRFRFFTSLPGPRFTEIRRLFKVVPSLTEFYRVSFTFHGFD